MRKRFAIPILFAALWAPAILAGQTGDGPLPNREATELMRRTADLFESTRIVIPELARAGAPLQENFRQGIDTLESSGNRNHTGVLYKMLTNARAYLQLADALPKPGDYSNEMRSQLLELRAKIETLDFHFRALLNVREEQALGADRDNLRRYAEANRQAGPTSETGSRVVFLGNSITAGWRLNEYFPGQSYLNRGIGGQITGQLLGRVKADAIDLQPAAVVVLGGTNDLARGVPDSTIRNNLEAIGRLLEAAGIRPVLASILPVHDYNQSDNPRFRRTPSRNPVRILELNRWLRALCEAEGWVYLNYFQAMLDESGNLQKGLSADGLHPNGEGYKIMAPLAQAAIEMALGPTTRKRGAWWRRLTPSR